MLAAQRKLLWSLVLMGWVPSFLCRSDASWRWLCAVCPGAKHPQRSASRHNGCFLTWNEERKRKWPGQQFTLYFLPTLLLLATRCLMLRRVILHWAIAWHCKASLQQKVSHRFTAKPLEMISTKWLCYIANSIGSTWKPSTSTKTFWTTNRSFEWLFGMKFWSSSSAWTKQSNKKVNASFLRSDAGDVFLCLKQLLSPTEKWLGSQAVTCAWNEDLRSSCLSLMWSTKPLTWRCRLTESCGFHLICFHKRSRRYKQRNRS